MLGGGLGKTIKVVAQAVSPRTVEWEGRKR